MSITVTLKKERKKRKEKKIQQNIMNIPVCLISPENMPLGENNIYKGGLYSVQSSRGLLPVMSSDKLILGVKIIIFIMGDCIRFKIPVAPSLLCPLISVFFGSGKIQMLACRADVSFILWEKECLFLGRWRQK
jgi:hypothetical protein